MEKNTNPYNNTEINSHLDHSNDKNPMIRCSDYDFYDYDDDDISDKCEIEGFTIEDYQIVVWNDKRHKGRGFIKYQTNPYLPSTTGDPYKDSQKVLDEIDPFVLPEARHPLVAACPEIIVNLEQIILSKNVNSSWEESASETNEKTQTIKSTTTNDHTISHILGGNASVNVSNVDVDVSLDLSYTHETTNVATLDEATLSTLGSGANKNWTEILNLDTARTAFLNTNIRYQNIGTAPIYAFQPTLSFVIGDKKNGSETVATITAQENSIANVILPNQTYPEIEQNPLAFKTSDDFSSVPIMLNYEQVKKLNQGVKLQIQMTQFLGFYGKKDIDTQMVTTSITESGGDIDIPFVRGERDGDSWNKIFSNIYAHTACITINLLDKTMQRRRVAAPKTHTPFAHHLPQLTLNEAIILAFPHLKVDVNRQTIGAKNGRQYFAKVVVDKDTHQEIIAKKLTNIFNLKLKQGMSIWITQKPQ